MARRTRQKQGGEPLHGQVTLHEGGFCGPAELAETQPVQWQMWCGREWPLARSRTKVRRDETRSTKASQKDRGRLHCACRWLISRRGAPSRQPPCQRELASATSWSRRLFKGSWCGGPQNVACRVATGKTRQKLWGWQQLQVHESRNGFAHACFSPSESLHCFAASLCRYGRTRVRVVPHSGMTPLGPGRRQARSHGFIKRGGREV